MVGMGFNELARDMQQIVFDTFSAEEDMVAVLYYPKSGIGPIAIDGIIKKPAQEESGLVSNVVRLYTTFEITSSDEYDDIQSELLINGIPLGPSVLTVTDGSTTINGSFVNGVTPVRGDELVMNNKRYVVQDVDVNRIGGCTLNLRSK